MVYIKRLIFTTDTNTVSYTNLDSSIFTYHIHLRYDSLIKYYGTSPFFYYDSIIEYSINQCNHFINGFRCSVGDFEPLHYHFEYGQGLDNKRGQPPWGEK